ncbi:hypothetical protein [Brevibacillus agri]|uniref:hypothetical protein n=1 Tax=Brevibacillus agri TaxID=51101 RepID=UPI00068533E4
MIFDAIEQYQNYYSVDKNGYHLNEEASQIIPEKTYKLLKETFDKTNEIFKTKQINRIGKRVKGGEITSAEGFSTYAVDEGYTYYGKDSDTYYYVGPNWDVGNWLYISDDDTRWLANVLVGVTLATTVAGIILSLFPATKGLAVSSAIIAAITGAGAAYIANVNKGYGIVVRAYSGGVTLKARKY